MQRNIESPQLVLSLVTAHRPPFMNYLLKIRQIHKISIECLVVLDHCLLLC